MTKLLVLHGPNLNLLGTREPNLYGQQTLEQIDTALKLAAQQQGFELSTFQSNAEFELINQIQQCKADFIIINPAAFTHTSVALRDALLAVKIPFIEVHLSNVFAREPFRQHSYFSDIARGVISGFGADSYHLALKAAINYLEQKI